MNFFIKNKDNIFKKIILRFISFYQNIISPLIPARCRYYPTCSNYGKQALTWHGSGTGSLLLLKRICRCHPLGGHGIDFVPLPLYSYYYEYSGSVSFLDATGFGVYKDSSSYVSRLNDLMKLQ